MWSLFAGRKLTLVAVIALAVGLTSFFTIQYIQSAEEGKVSQEILNQQIEKRKEIDEAVSNSPVDANDGLQYLRDRQGD